MLDEIRVISIADLKREISAELEYDHPDRELMARSPHAVTYGFKPVVDGIFFDSDEDAVEHVFTTNAMFSKINTLEAYAQVLECYDDEEDTLHYSLYEEKESLHLNYAIFSLSQMTETTYRFIFEKEVLTLFNDTNGIQIHCDLKENACVWSESIEKLFDSERVMYPATFAPMMEHLWLSWRGNVIMNEQVKEELSALINWVDAMTRTTPTSSFWNQNI